MCEISTRAWQRSYMARGMRRVPTYYQDLFDIIGKNPGHIIGSTACLGGCLPTQILCAQSKSDLYPKIEIWIQQMLKLFGEGNFFFEMQPSFNEEQVYVNKKLLDYSEKFNIPYIITTDSHYLKKADRPIHKAYLNSQNGDREVDDFYATTYMMDTDELEKYFSYFTKENLNKAYENIIYIKNNCEDYSIEKPLKIPELLWRPLKHNLEEYDYKKAFNLIPNLKIFYNSPYKSDKYLVNAILDGIEAHPDLQNQEAYNEINENLNRTWESSEVNKARWSAYYLNLQKNIDECWAAGTIVGPSRGSGGGFILLYCLDVIQMNKLREETPMYSWRFLNPARVSVLDIDTDIEGSKRDCVIHHLKEVYGEDRVANVATFRTETTKSAILTSCRGLGIDNDVAQYITSLIPSDRGKLRTLNQCMYGDEENGWKPVTQFVTEMTANYPEVWEVALKIEGLINGSGLHAGGIIFVDEPFTNSTALMRAPDGTICTQFDLHDDEFVSLIKIDLLSVEAMDKIHNCIDLLCDYRYAERKNTLRETYESIVGIYNLERKDPKMWKMVLNHEIQSLFQLEKASGVNGISIAQPSSVADLAVLNSVIRLMAPEKGAEQPLDMWARYREDINNWINEMRQYGLNEEQIKWLTHHNAIHNGICESQEGLMSLVQEEKIGGNSLTFADSCRKAIAKKEGKLFDECENFYFKNAEEKGCDMRLVHYIWDVVFKPQRGYSFNASHTHAYSLIALQEMNLAYKYPIVFWNCACLINDAGGNESEELDEDIEENCVEEFYFNEMEEFGPEDNEDEIEDSYEEEDCDGYPVEVVTLENGKKKKKTRTTAYGKIATAIGKMTSEGIKIIPPDINISKYTFSPDVKNNAIRYGLSGISMIGEDIIRETISNRPYKSIEDYLSKVKLSNPKVVSLIKAGAFDSFGDRKQIMHQYIDSIADKKNTINLRNMQMLINFGLIPEEYNLQQRFFNFNKYLRKLKINDDILLDNIAYKFYEENCDVDDLNPDNRAESSFSITKSRWDKKYYQPQMDKIRPWVKKHSEELKEKINARLWQDMWDKYSLGSLSKWEMDSISCYFHNHELKNVNEELYNCEDYFNLPEEPEVDRVFYKNGKPIPLYKLTRIMGTVLDRDKNKNTVTLLTKRGVVNVKIYGNAFANYDKQISIKNPVTGKKQIYERSWFKRGNKIIVNGMRRGSNEFIAKKYASTPYSLVELITEINEDGTIETQSERMEV